MRGADSMAPANPFTVLSSLSTVHGTTCDCRNGPDHCIMVTAIDWLRPPRMALSTRWFWNAAT